MIVDCVHPVPVRAVLPGMRNETVTFLSHRTPVELRVVPASDFEPVEWGSTRPPLMEGPWAGAGMHDLFRRGERLWHRLVRYRHDSRSTWCAPLRPDEFRGLLEGATLTDGNDFGKHFVGTPVARLWGGVWQGSDREMTSRGAHDFPCTRQGARPRVVASYDAEARTALHAMFEEDVAIAGDEVFVKVAGPMLVADRRVSPVADRLTLFPRMFQGFLFGCHVDGQDALAEMIRLSVGRIPWRPALSGDHPDEVPSMAVTPGSVTVPRNLIGSSDIEVITAEIPGIVQVALKSIRGHRDGRAAAGRPEVLALKERLASAVPLAEIGVFAQPGIEERVECLLADVQFVRGLPGGDSGMMRAASSYLLTTAIPRLQGKPTPEDDEAIGGLTP